MFNVIFSVMPMFVALFWSISLLIGADGNLSKKFLSFFLFLSTINYFTHFAFFNNLYEWFGFLDNIWVFTSLVGYPLYYYYVRLLTKDLKINWRWIWILVPAFLITIFSFVIYFKMSSSELDVFIHNVMYHENNTIVAGQYSSLVELQILRTKMFKIVFFLEVIFSVYFAYKLIVEHNSKIRSFYSNVAGKDLGLVKWVIQAFLFASIVSIVSNFIGKDYFVEHNSFLVIPSITHSMFLFFIGYVGFRQDFTIVDFNRDLVQELPLPDKNNKSSFCNEDIHSTLKSRLLCLFEEEKVFKNPELRITDVASLLGSNRTYTSRIVNEDFDTNFCDFVNSYRVDYAKKLILEDKDNKLSTNDISVQAGFSSESSFYRAFKLKMGMTPVQYRKSLMVESV